jgi:Protein of unknown function (DUF3106)
MSGLQPSQKLTQGFAVWASFFVLWAACGMAGAQALAAPADSKVSAKAAAEPAIESRPTWAQLKPADQTALKPMQTDWAGLDVNRKKKWLAVAQRYQAMSPADQARMHSRMADWGKLTPAQRSTARDNYSAVLSSPSSSADPAGKANLSEQWAKYQALSPEKKASLNEQANKQSETVKTKPLMAQ